MISIIIPTYNEEQCIEQTLQNVLRLKTEAQFEVIVSDGESSDTTVAIAKRYARVVQSKKGRGRQLNAAARVARGNIFFFVHADMFLPEGTLRAINQKINHESYDGGGFSNTFSSYNTRIKSVGRILNFKIFNDDHPKNTIFFGDNGIFVKRTVFEVLEGFKPIPIMEDYDFSRRMGDQFNAVRIMDPKLVASPRRHAKSGFLKTQMQWIIIKRLFLLGVSPESVAKWYRDVR